MTQVIDKNSLVIVHKPADHDTVNRNLLSSLVAEAVKQVREGKGPVVINVPADTYISIIEVAPAADDNA